MNDEDKPKGQLIDELKELRRRIAELEASEAVHKQLQGPEIARHLEDAIDRCGDVGRSA